MSRLCRLSLYAEVPLVSGSVFCAFQTLTDVSECLSLQPLPGSQYPYNYPAGQMGYWYPQGYPTAAQVQGQQFIGMQGFAYGQYGYQQG